MSETQLPKSEIVPVSVIVPAYNGERFIRAAIESVQNQTLAVAEIIVVDDGSRDRTAEFARALGVTVIQQANHGVCAARNAGIRLARNEWIAFIDQDNLWEPDKIEHQWRAIQAYPDTAAVSCHMSWFADESIRGQAPEFAEDAGLGEENDGQVAYISEVGAHLPLSRMIDYSSSLVLRREVLISVGLFDQELWQNEDLECFLRVVAHSPLAIVRRALVKHRVHDQNTSLRDPEGAAATYEKILSWLRLYPERYPKGAARAYARALALRHVSAGRELLEKGESTEARALLRQSLAMAFSLRAALLWCSSFLSPSIFRFLLSLKRLVLVTSSGRGSGRRTRA